MKCQYIYRPTAIVEFKEAVQWYLTRSEAAAEGFVREVNEKIGMICEDPLRYKNLHKNFKETSLKKIPYSIVYYWDKDQEVVFITSVYHQKRSPRRKYIK